MSPSSSHSSRHSCALITGASSGLGREYAKQLAPFADTIVLVSRRKEALEEVAQELVSKNQKLTVKIFASDLSEASSRSTLLDSLAAENLRPDLLINNAGMGDYGEFRDSDWEKTSDMIRLNVEALTHLSHALLDGLIEQKGALLNVSSLASALPIPDFSAYAATKAYVTSFSEALRIEMLEHGVNVLAVCPGPVKTGFGDRALRDSNSKIPGAGFFDVTPEQVVQDSLSALMKGRARIYPGFKVACAAAGIALIPWSILRMIMATRPRKSS